MKLSPNWLNFPQTKRLISVFSEQNAQLRFVGGAVRDAVLGLEASDVDAATTLKPQEVLELLEKAKIRAIATSLEHGTITAVIDKKSFEITTLRRDVACDGRHAQIAYSNDWEDDAKRRDFTMNALYLGMDGELFDYFGGVEDARAGVVRFIGDARARICEDYLRILRFFRFYAIYGKGEVDKTALDACIEYADKISTLSGERIQHEMLKLLASKSPDNTLKLMQENGVFKQVFGFNLHSDIATKMAGELAALKLALLILNADIPPQAVLQNLAKRWKISGKLKDKLTVLITHVYDISLTLSIAEQKKLIRKFGADVFSDLVQLASCQSLGMDTDLRRYDEMRNLAKNWQIPVFPISGEDLLLLGMTQGKQLGERLKQLENTWEASDYALSREQLLKIPI